VHPASRILTYLLAALVIPGLPFFVLTLLLFLPLAFSAWLRQSPWRLVWRTRWLLLVLFLGYGYSLPGASAATMLGDWSPSLPGLARGTEQALRLVVLLLWLDLLVLRMPAERLMAGLYTLSLPLRRLRVDVARLTLRLGLTLRAVESLERGRGNLVHLLDEGAASGLPDRVILPILPMRGRDWLLPSLLLALVVATWFSA
jgi:energy-coupling factor transporter transmembrane protein EcfT